MFSIGWIVKECELDEGMCECILRIRNLGYIWRKGSSVIYFAIVGLYGDVIDVLEK